MSRESLFDKISRIVASPMPRRRAFRLIAGGFFGGAVPSLLADMKLYAQPGLGLTQCPAVTTCGPYYVNGAVVCCGYCCPQFFPTCVGWDPTSTTEVCCSAADCEMTVNASYCTNCLMGRPTAGATCRQDGSGKCYCPTAQLCSNGSQCCPSDMICGTDGMTCCTPCPTTCCPTGKQCEGGSCVCVKTNTISRIKSLAAGPPTQLSMMVQNATYGIFRVEIATAVNCTVSPSMPMFPGGSLNPVLSTATKTDQTQSAKIVLSVFTAGDCMDKTDPIFTVLKIATGKWVRQSFADVQPTDRYLTVTNGSSGFERIGIWVNSRHYNLPLAEGETRSLDLGSAMTGNENTVTFVGFGSLGANANIILVDTPPESESPSGLPKIVQEEGGLVHRHSPIWGPLSEETEENSDLHIVDIANQTVKINFNGALSTGAGSDPSMFTVQVNGKTVMVEKIQKEAATRGGHDMTLQLPFGAVHTGDTVDVYWEDLPNPEGRPLSGHVPLLAQ